MAESEIETCSFCGLSSQSVEKMIKGNDKAYICNECIGLSLHILIKEDKRGDVKQLFDNIPAEVLLAFIK